MRSEALQKKLLSEKDLNFDKAVETATAFEMASKGAAGMSATNRSESQRALNYVVGGPKKSNHNNSKSWTTGGNKDGKSCSCCGKNGHARQDCWYKGKKCNVCQKVGHLAAACREKNNQKQQNNKFNKKQNKVANNENVSKQNFLAEKDESWTDDFNKLFTISDKPSVENVKPFEETILVNNVEVSFEVDTGAAVTAISEKYYRNSHLKDLPMLPTEKYFNSYWGASAKALGKILVEAQCEDVTCKLELYVLPGRENPILGRIWLV